MTFYVEKSLYDREALLKTAYCFTDEYYVHLDSNEDYYLVDISRKDDLTPDNIEALFHNELVNQATRNLIFKKTNTIRQLILARAFASTIIETTDVDNESVEAVDTNNVFNDWFENEERKK